MARRDLNWSKEDLMLLRDLATKCTSTSDISKRLNRSQNAIRLTAKRYGIELYHPGRIWKNEDKDFLRRHWGVVPLWYLSNKLHRSGSAVIEMAHKMRLEPIYHKSEDIGLMDFVRATSIKRERILKTLAPKYGFPLIKRKNGERQTYYYVDFEKILGWMEQHQDLYDASEIDDDFFVEPRWLTEKRRRDKEDNSYLHWSARRRPWQESEISALKQMAKAGKTSREISEKLGRSQICVIDKMWKVQM